MVCDRIKVGLREYLFPSKCAGTEDAGMILHSGDDDRNWLSRRITKDVLIHLRA